MALFDKWRVATTTFEEDLALEYRDAAWGFVDAYLAYVNRVIRGDLMAHIESPIASFVVEDLMQLLPSEQPAEDRLRQCCAFLRSDHFKSAPTQSLSACLFAALKDSVKNGAYSNAEKARKRLAGVFFDIDHISTYAPYCDAIILDKPMAELVAHRGVALASRYPVRVFSLNNWDELFAWLDEIEASASDEHNAALAAIR